MTDEAKAWSDRLRATQRGIETHMSALNVPVVLGRFTSQGAATVLIDEPLFDKYASVIEPGSLCVIDLRAPDQDDLDDGEAPFESLIVHVRLGRSSTWLTYRLVATRPVQGLDPEAPWPFETGSGGESWEATQLPEELLNRLAVRVANAPGFGALRNRSERSDFACAVLEGDEAAHALKDYDYYEIAVSAETLYRAGVLPSLAKRLDQEGKKISEVAAILGVSRDRAKSAIAAVVPDNIAKILNSAGDAA